MNYNSSGIINEVPILNRLIFSILFFFQCWWPGNRLLERLRKLNSQFTANYLKRVKGSNRNTTIEVDRYTQISEKEFKSKYLRRGIPVIFEGGAKNWPSTQKWDLDFLKERFGDEEFLLLNSKGLVEVEYEKENIDNNEAVLERKISGKDFVDSIRMGSRHYLRGCAILEKHPDLLQDLDLAWLKKMRDWALGVSFQTFLGSGNRRTPMHAETTPFFFILAEGEKRWTMYTSSASTLLNPRPERRGYFYSRVDYSKPDLSQFPGFNFLNCYQCVIKKGDILFVPAWTWHDVETFTESWAVSFRFLSYYSIFKHPLFTLNRILLGKPSIFSTIYYSFFGKNMSDRSRGLLIPRIKLKE